MRSAWFHLERVGRVSVLHVRGYLDRSVEEKFQRALRDAAAGPADSVLTVSLLECCYINYPCLLTLSCLSELVQKTIHVIAAPGSEARRMLQLPQLGGVPVHDGFREAFLSIAAASLQRQTNRQVGALA